MSWKVYRWQRHTQGHGFLCNMHETYHFLWPGSINFRYGNNIRLSKTEIGKDTIETDGDYKVVHFCDSKQEFLKWIYETYWEEFL